MTRNISEVKLDIRKPYVTVRQHVISGVSCLNNRQLNLVVDLVKANAQGPLSLPTCSAYSKPLTRYDEPGQALKRIYPRRG